VLNSIQYLTHTSNVLLKAFVYDPLPPLLS